MLTGRAGEHCRSVRSCGRSAVWWWGRRLTEYRSVGCGAQRSLLRGFRCDACVRAAEWAVERSRHARGGKVHCPRRPARLIRGPPCARGEGACRGTVGGPMEGSEDLARGSTSGSERIEGRRPEKRERVGGGSIRRLWWSLVWTHRVPHRRGKTARRECNAVHVRCDPCHRNRRGPCREHVGGRARCPGPDAPRLKGVPGLPREADRQTPIGPGPLLPRGYPRKTRAGLCVLSWERSRAAPGAPERRNLQEAPEKGHPGSVRSLPFRWGVHAAVQPGPPHGPGQGVLDFGPREAAARR